LLYLLQALPKGRGKGIVGDTTHMRNLTYSGLVKYCR
jgi:hypothetical protein